MSNTRSGCSTSSQAVRAEDVVKWRAASTPRNDAGLGPGRTRMRPPQLQVRDQRRQHDGRQPGGTAPAVTLLFGQCMRAPGDRDQRFRLIAITDSGHCDRLWTGGSQGTVELGGGPLRAAPPRSDAAAVVRLPFLVPTRFHPVPLRFPLDPAESPAVPPVTPVPPGQEWRKDFEAARFSRSDTGGSPAAQFHNFFLKHHALSAGGTGGTDVTTGVLVLFGCYQSGTGWY